MDPRSLIRKIPDYPSPGHTYYDLTTLLADGPGFHAVIDLLAARYAPRGIKKFACMEWRGFIIGSALAYRLEAKGLKIRYNARAVTRHYHPMSVDSFARRQYTVGKSGAIFYRKHPELGHFLGVHELESRALADERELERLRRRARMGERFRFLAKNRVFETLMREHYLRGLKDGLQAC